MRLVHGALAGFILVTYGSLLLFRGDYVGGFGILVGLAVMITVLIVG